MSPTIRHGARHNALALASIFAAAPLVGCAALHDTVATPNLSSLVYPAREAPIRPPMLESRDDSPRPASANSLWRNGARSFFHDQRAARVGDILTVNIAIADSANLQNESIANRTAASSGGVGGAFGGLKALTRLLPKGGDPTKLVSSNSSLASDGKGSVARSEAVTLTVAAEVSSVLPNGNLVIAGRQEVRINSELRELTITGIVRPEDITSANTVSHTQIAEARVSYGGKGQISNVQRAPALQGLLGNFSPF